MRASGRFHFLSAALLTLTVCPGEMEAVSTPAPPPAGIVERQIELEYDAKEVQPGKELPLLEIDIPEKQFDVGEGSVFIDKIVFEGNTVFSAKELQKSAAPYLHKELSMQEIKTLCLEVQKKYAAKGYFLTRAYVPAQEIKQQTLKITVIEGKLGRVKVIGNKHYSKKFIRNHFRKYQGKPIQYDQMLKALLLIGDNMDLSVGAIFKKGKEFGTADVIIQVKDKRPLHLSVDHNNYGSYFTSKQRTGAVFDWGNVLTDGDQFKVVEVVGMPFSSLDFTQGIYRYPLNTYGSVLEGGYLFANFAAEDAGDGLKVSGRSHIATVKFDQALFRTKRLNTDLFTQFDYKQIQNFGNGLASSYDKLRVLTGGMNFDYIDGWKGRNLINFSAGWGIPDIFGGMDVHEVFSSRVDSGGLFFKFNGGYKRLQTLPRDCFLLLNIVGQYSWYKLPLPEQIYIGGFDTVRGYRLAEGLGDSGFYLNFELRVPPPFLQGRKVPWSSKTWGEFFQFVGFLDHGRTTSVGADLINEVVRDQDHHKHRKAVKQNGKAILTAAGVGFRVYGPWKLEFSFDAAYPLTDRFRSSTTLTYYRVAWHIL